MKWCINLIFTYRKVVPIFYSFDLQIITRASEGNPRYKLGISFSISVSAMVLNLPRISLVTWPYLDARISLPAHFGYYCAEGAWVRQLISINLHVKSNKLAFSKMATNFRLKSESTQLTNIYIYGRPKLKDVEQFWNGLFRGFREKVSHLTSEFIVKLYRELMNTLLFNSNYVN